jgi:hypothetical protein
MQDEYCAGLAGEVSSKRSEDASLLGSQDDPTINMILVFSINRDLYRR